MADLDFAGHLSNHHHPRRGDAAVGGVAVHGAAGGVRANSVFALREINRALRELDDEHGRGRNYDSEHADAQRGRSRWRGVSKYGLDA